YLGGFKDMVDAAKNKEKGYTEEVNNNGTGNNNSQSDDSNTTTSVKDIKTESLEIPASSYKVTRHAHFALGYDERHEQAAWVAYKLEARETRGRAEREDRFIPDPSVTTRTARHSDYSGSGYDRGHLAPAADFKFSKKAMAESFYMSNMSPQKPRFNRGIWKSLEEQVREHVRKDKAYYIVTGPVLKGGRFRKIGRKTKVSVPKYYYKILLDLEEPEIKAIAFLMKNEGSDKPLSSFVVSIDKVEEITGIDFFPNLPDDLEKKLEASTSLKGWSFD
ncbi:DNA/RNA non-specific endonuclease, partial [Microscilla marina]